MSIPDSIGYLNYNAQIFTRQSEYEIDPALYSQAVGVWMDEFNQSWIDEKNIHNHILNGKKVCIVSPELHKRDFKKEWKKYKFIFLSELASEISICTDFPELASKYFII